MTAQQAIDTLSLFIDWPSESDDWQADAIEALGVIQRQGDYVLDLLVSIHHQLATDSDLDTVTAPDKYRALRMRIEGVLAHTPYAYLCTGGPQE